MFLNESYFRGELSLPNVKLSNPRAGVGSILQTVGELDLLFFIEKYEYNFLVHILGIELTEQMISNKGDNGKFDALINKIFVQREHGSYSPAANYVYVMVMLNGRSQTSSTGEVRKRTDNMSVVSDRNKIVRAWNEMGEMIGNIHLFIRNSGEYGTIENSCIGWFKAINQFDI